MTTQRFFASMREGLNAVYAAIDDTIIGDIRANRMRLVGLRGESQILAVLSIIFVITGIVLMILSPQIRQSFSMYSLPDDGHVNGTLIPLPVIAVIGFTVCAAWSLLLYACTSMAWWIRLGATMFHTLLMAIWLIPLSGSDITYALATFVLLLVIAGLTLMRHDWDSAWRWVWLFSAEALMLGISHWQYLTLFQQSGINILLVGVALIMQQHSFIVAPMMFYIGINMTRAAINFGQWGRIAIADATVQQIALSVILMVVLRLLQIPEMRLPTGEESVVVLVYLGVIGLVALAVARLDHTRPQQTVDELLLTYAPWLVLASIAPVLVYTIINFGLGGANMLAGATNTTLLGWWSAYSQNSGTVTTVINMTMTCGYVGVAWYLWRTQHPIGALYFVLVATIRIMAHALDYFHVFLRVHVSDTSLFLICAIYLISRLRFSAERALRLGQLLSLTVISYFMQQLEFLNNPLSPIFSYAGIFFVGFGFIWDTLVGAGWVNEASPGFPRHARLFGYLGYTLMTITVVMWAGFSLNPDLLALMSGQNAVNGIYTFGFPAVHLLYVIIVVAPNLAFVTPPTTPVNAHAILSEQSPQ